MFLYEFHKFSVNYKKDNPQFGNPNVKNFRMLNIVFCKLTFNACGSESTPVPAISPARNMAVIAIPNP